MEISEAVKIAAPLFHAQKSLEDEDLVNTLTEVGVPLLLARRIVVFMPLAFGRIMLKELNVNVSDVYEYFQKKGGFTDKKRRKLVDEPVYKESLKLAAKMAGKETTGQIFLAIAFRSAEVNAVNQMELQGSKPENIVLTPMLTMWDLYEESDNLEASQTKNWWEFWK
jgi:hypothetical protein